MKKQFKNLILPIILVVFTTTLKAQSPNVQSASWKLAGNAAVGGEKLGTTTAVDLNLYTNNFNRMTITSTGNVGIGTIYPSQKLEVFGGDAKIHGITVGLGGGSGGANTALGSTALLSNTSGQYNSAVGLSALYSNTTGYTNTAIGGLSLYLNNTGTYNTGCGALTLYNNSTGNENTANGHQALYNTTGSYNTGIGVSSLYSNTSGTFNTGLGDGSNVSAGNLTNATAIGANAIVNASNKMVLGLPGTVVWANGGVVAIVSDSRFKDEVKESDAPGLDFINKLRPVTYKFNYKRYDDFLRKDMDASKIKTNNAYQQHLIEKGEQREIGFIAQEVEKTVKDYGYTFNGVYSPQNSNDNYGLDYTKFVMPLVKSVQELSKENEDLKKQLLALSARIDALENRSVSSSQIKSQTINSNDFHLYQVAPNPFSQKATISFKLPAYTSNAQLLITDATGKTVKTYILSTGSTHQDIYANNLAAGVYHYSLVVNEKIIDSKQMVIIR